MAEPVKRVSVKVRAIKPGFDVSRRRVGDEFSYQARVDSVGNVILPSWLVLNLGDPVPEVKKVDETKTFAQGAAESGADLA